MRAAGGRRRTDRGLLCEPTLWRECIAVAGGDLVCTLYALHFPFFLFFRPLLQLELQVESSLSIRESTDSQQMPSSPSCPLSAFRGVMVPNTLPKVSCRT